MDHGTIVEFQEAAAWQDQAVIHNIVWSLDKSEITWMISSFPKASLDHPMAPDFVLQPSHAVSR